jgi:hypothetical protein
LLSHDAAKDFGDSRQLGTDICGSLEINALVYENAIILDQAAVGVFPRYRQRVLSLEVSRL